MQTEMAQAAGQVFRQLNDADLKFGAVKDEKGEWIELSHATFSTLLHSPKRSVRKTAFDKYYRQFADHEHTLAATLNGSIQRDIYYARARNHPSALEAALFPDRVPVAVYDNLIDSVHRHLPALHRYYDVRRRKMRLREIHHYDTYVPILSELQTRHTWNQAVELVLDALEPLGSDYCGVLERGLRGRWCDRYENRGKQSGAFSCGSFDGDPYILMNYQPDVLDHVFTLAHEAGHSMHSYYSAKQQPYQYYDYVIFVAEVASTFNEQLLSRHLLEPGPRRPAAGLPGQPPDRRHAGDHLPPDDVRRVREDHPRSWPRRASRSPSTASRRSTANCWSRTSAPTSPSTTSSTWSASAFRTSTGRSTSTSTPPACRPPSPWPTASSAAAASELDDYLGFLKGGCSKDPLDLLRDAGVDMEQPARGRHGPGSISSGWSTNWTSCSSRRSLQSCSVQSRAEVAGEPGR